MKRGSCSPVSWISLQLSTYSEHLSFHWLKDLVIWLVFETEFHYVVLPDLEVTIPLQASYRARNLHFFSLFPLINLFTFIYLMCMSVLRACIDVHYVYSWCWWPRGAAVVSNHVGAGNGIWVFCTISSFLTFLSRQPFTFIHIYMCACMWMLEDNLLEQVFPFYHVDSGNQTQAI